MLSVRGTAAAIDGGGGSEKPAGEATAGQPGGGPAVYFERRSSELSQEARAVIAQNAERLKSDPSASVTLVGYADGVGSSSYGVALAQRRASAVGEALVGMGVDPRQIRSTAYGEETGVAAPCAAGPCAAGYRMVAFRYLEPQAPDLRWRAPHEAR